MVDDLSTHFDDLYSTRKHASKLSEEENEYTFNLDLRDGIKEYKDKRYTVCAYTYGEASEGSCHTRLSDSLLGCR